jgi:hypothetical protein
VKRFGGTAEIQVAKLSCLTVDAEWNEDGAVMIFFGGDGNTHPACPRCSFVLSAGIEHRCGDRVERKVRA